MPQPEKAGAIVMVVTSDRRTGECTVIHYPLQDRKGQGSRQLATVIAPVEMAVRSLPY